MTLAKSASLQQKPRNILVLAKPTPLTQERGLVGRLKGHTIYWYSAKKASIEGVAMAFTPPTFKIKRPTKLVLLLRFLHFRRLINSLQLDLIHVHYAHQVNWITWALLRFKPLIVTVMGSDILLPGQDFHWVKKLLDHADIITSKSDFLDSTLKQYGDYSHKIRRVTWGVDTQKFQPGLDTRYLRSQWQIQPGQFIFLSPRTCRPLYNHHLIIQAFARYLYKNNSKAVLLIGELFKDELYCQQLKNLVAELKLNEQVRFIGAISHEEMPAYFNLADAVISIPSSDGMPQTLYEAMACKTYSILGDLASYREIIQNGVNGHLAPIGDIEALAEAMVWVTKHPNQLEKAGDFNRNYIMKIANQADQAHLVNEIYAELFSRYNR
jgi:glycosyltransferase involved in cell wall biosynthesis